MPAGSAKPGGSSRVKAGSRYLFFQLSWHAGGCSHPPLCRHNHRCKQAEGWWLDQPEPGVLIWHTPTGRMYVTTPTIYPL